MPAQFVVNDQVLYQYGPYYNACRGTVTAVAAVSFDCTVVWDRTQSQDVIPQDQLTKETSIAGPPLVQIGDLVRFSGFDPGGSALNQYELSNGKWLRNAAFLVDHLCAFQYCIGGVLSAPSPDAALMIALDGRLVGCFQTDLVIIPAADYFG